MKTFAQVHGNSADQVCILNDMVDVLIKECAIIHLQSRIPRPGFHSCLELATPLTTKTQTIVHKCQAMTSLSTLHPFRALATTSACHDTKVQHRSFGFRCTHLKGAAGAKRACPHKEDAKRQSCCKNNTYHGTCNTS